jgi:hypothetical protein
MSRLSRQITVVAVGVGTLLGSLGAATAASAAPAGCSASLGCTYSEANYAGSGNVYNGGKLHFYYQIKDYMDYFVIPGIHMNDKVSSIYNNGSRAAATFWSNRAYKGKVVRLERQQGVANLATKGLNDQLSSACFDGYCK